MRRNASSLAARRFDVLLIGGGIHGLAVAYDAAQRGLSTALVERGDFGSGSSFNHAKTVHGKFKSPITRSCVTPAQKRTPGVRATPGVLAARRGI